MSGLENCVNSSLMSCNGRVSPRLSLYEQLEKAVELFCHFNGYPVDKDMVEFLSTMLSIKYAAYPNTIWHNDMIMSSKVVQYSGHIPKSTHSMVRRSQTTV